jgi:hypothetical protein
MKNDADSFIEMENIYNIIDILRLNLMDVKNVSFPNEKKQIERWIQQLEQLKTEIQHSGIPIKNSIDFFESLYSELEEKPIIKASVQQNITAKASEGDKLKIGEYVRTKLRRLADSGFVWSKSQLADLLSDNWGHLTFGVVYPFAIKYDGNIPFSKLTKDSKGRNRYWSEIFDFSGCQLLFCSQWYENNRERFDEWFSKLQ